MNLLWLLVGVAAVAPPPPSNPIDARRLDRNPPAAEVQPAPPAPPTIRARAPRCTTPIRAIRFEPGAAPAAVAAAAEAFIGRTCSNDLLVELTSALSDAYERTDVALYTVAIPEQDFTDGVVRVELVEGWVDRVEIAAGAGPSPRLERMAGLLVGRKPLTRSALERQSALIQSIPGLTVESSLENLEGDDSVALVLVPKRKKWQAALGINNRGSRLLGQSIVQGGIDVYSLLVDGDQVSASAYASTDPKHFRAFDAGYALPLTASGLTLSLAGGKIFTRARKMDVRGSAEFAVLSLSYPLVRRERLAVDVALSLDGVNSDNALFGNIFTTERTRAVRLVGSLASSLGETSIKASAVISRGIAGLGARTGGTGNEAGFTKLNLTGEVERAFSERLIGRAYMIAQYSRDRLPGTELMPVGGPLIGRGFDTSFLSADRGIGGLAELAFRPVAAGNFETSEIYAFADAARVRINRRSASPGQGFGLASAGIGARLRYKDRMELGIEGAHVLDRPQFYTRSSRLSLYYAIKF